MNKKTPYIGVQARTQIAETLPKAIEKAIESYHGFVDNPDAEESVAFKNHHTAAKAALAHLELLMKLAALVDAVNDAQSETLTELIKNAQKELDRDNA